MVLLQDPHFANAVKLAGNKRLPGLMRHKAENLVDRLRRRNMSLDVNFLKARNHHLWASQCVRHMASLLERFGVAEILAVEHRLPTVKVVGLKEVDTGEVDILGYSHIMKGLVAIEIKNRILTEKCEVREGRAWENAAGIALLSGRNGWPPLAEMVWVFYTPHPKNLNLPLADEKPLGYTPDKVAAYFERRHGGLPHLPFLL
ncbi:MAG: hypothetical protein COY40_04030 [Alphaproteobacteria bacterium CG_4_10_14_0_8_um_filter_53_9]|nr:MAG: hypothetical protein COY40_04030 [Alphaproteobacteria bacterium CG_4_10_14_0_8_um_filter_53_9]